MSRRFYRLGANNLVAEPADCSKLKLFTFTAKGMTGTDAFTLKFQLWSADGGSTVDLEYIGTEWAEDTTAPSIISPSPADAYTYDVCKVVVSAHGYKTTDVVVLVLTVDGVDRVVTLGAMFPSVDILADTSVVVKSVAGTSDGCLAEGTHVRLADGGVKRVEDVGYGDKLLVWDGAGFAAARPEWIMRTWRATHWFECRFRSGRTLCTTGADGDPGHRVLDLTTGRYEYERDAIGHRVRTLSATGRVGEPTVFAAAEDVLESVTCVAEPCWAYNVITEGHFNMLAEDIVTSCRLSNPGMTPEEIAAYRERLERMRKPREEA